jgi:hypothetical protein
MSQFAHCSIGHSPGYLKHGLKRTMATLFTQSITTDEESRTKTIAMSRWFCLFGSTVFVGAFLCLGYVAARAHWFVPYAMPGIIRSQSAGTSSDHTHSASEMGVSMEIMDARSHESWVVISLPDPPSPFPASASQAIPEIVAENRDSRHSPLKLDMVATQDAWVEVETDGNITYAKLLRNEQTLSFEASERIRMSTGNAPGLQVKFNGELVAASDAKRRVRTLEFTSEGLRGANPQEIAKF